MDEIGTTDIADFTLPGSGTIKLSQIKSEFNKGNNLKAYYGAASGIPSSGTIKVTDFYGKSSGGDPVGPSGSYQSSYVKHYQTTDPDNIGTPQFSYTNLYHCAGTGAGNPTKWGDEAGVFCQDKAYYDSCTVRKVSVLGNSEAINSNYPYLKIGPTSGPSDYRTFAGSWGVSTFTNYYDKDNSSLGTFAKTSTLFSNKAAAEYLWSIMQQGLPFFMSVASSAQVSADETIIYDDDEEGDQ